MTLYNWINTFHNTTVRSSLNYDGIRMIGASCKKPSQHKDSRKLKRLLDSLCPHRADKLNECLCGALNKIEDYDG